MTTSWALYLLCVVFYNPLSRRKSNLLTEFIETNTLTPGPLYLIDRPTDRNPNTMIFIKEIKSAKLCLPLVPFILAVVAQKDCDCFCI